MTCEEFRQMLDEYTDGLLDDVQRAEMEKHAGSCAACREEMDAAIQLSSLLQGLDDEISVPLEAQAAWRRAVRAEAKQPVRRMNGWMRAVGTVAAALVVLVTGTYGMRMGEEAAVSAPQPTIMAAGVMEDGFGAEQGGRGYSRVASDRMGSGVLLQSDGEVTTDSTTAVSTEAEISTPFVIRSAERSVRSDSYDADYLWLEDLVSEYDAYFEERTVMAAAEDGSLGRVANAVMRVPSDRLDDFLMELDQLGRTVLSGEYSEEVGRYQDTGLRLNALKLQREKLEEMLAAAQSIEELIAIDEKLTEVITSIEMLESDLHRWDSQESYSRVKVTLTETLEEKQAAPETLGQRMQHSFRESVEWLRQFGQDALVTAAAMAPRLVIWIPAAVLVIVLVCALRAGKRKR